MSAPVGEMLRAILRRGSLRNVQIAAAAEPHRNAGDCGGRQREHVRVEVAGMHDGYVTAPAPCGETYCLSRRGRTDQAAQWKFGDRHGRSDLVMQGARATQAGDVHVEVVGVETTDELAHLSFCAARMEAVENKGERNPGTRHACS